jgi:hypothetical protein
MGEGGGGEARDLKLNYFAVLCGKNTIPDSSKSFTQARSILLSVIL